MRYLIYIILLSLVYFNCQASDSTYVEKYECRNQVLLDELNYYFSIVKNTRGYDSLATYVLFLSIKNDSIVYIELMDTPSRSFYKEGYLDTPYGFIQYSSHKIQLEGDVVSSLFVSTKNYYTLNNYKYSINMPYENLFIKLIYDHYNNKFKVVDKNLED